MYGAFCRNEIDEKTFIDGVRETARQEVNLRRKMQSVLNRTKRVHSPWVHQRRDRNENTDVPAPPVVAWPAGCALVEENATNSASVRSDVGEFSRRLMHNRRFNDPRVFSSLLYNYKNEKCICSAFEMQSSEEACEVVTNEACRLRCGCRKQDILYY